MKIDPTFSKEESKYFVKLTTRLKHNLSEFKISNAHNQINITWDLV